MKTLTLAAAAIGLAVTATPAFADSPEAPTMKVKISDIDLATPQGQKTLDRRINKAARKMCGFNDARSGSRLQTASQRTCFATAHASAKRQVAAIMANKNRGG